jgi:hypothetical protein
MKTLTFTSLFLIISGFFALRAQNLHVGLSTAYNATFVLDKGLSKDPRYNSTYTWNMAPIGFNFGVELGKKFGLSLESILSKQGQIYKIIDAAEQIKGERKIDVRYLNIPMLLKFTGAGNGAARTNFNFGPQLSLLTKASETIQAQAGNFTIPEGLTLEDIQKDFPSAVAGPSAGQYSIPTSETAPREVLSKKLDSFKNAEFQIAIAFGLDIDLSKHLFLSTQVRANYSFTDMRNGDVIDKLKSGNASAIFGQRANMLVGVQMALHYSLRATRSHRD